MDGFGTEQAIFTIQLTFLSHDVDTKLFKLTIRNFNIHANTMESFLFHYDKSMEATTLRNIKWLNVQNVQLK
jgi:hypothetical protein